MTCDQIQACLEAFAGGELGWGTAWHVRRHLAGCAACAAQLAEIRQLDRRARAWRDVPAPTGLENRIAAALPSASPALNAPPHRALVTRRAAVGLAGVAAAVSAFFWLLPGQPGRPTIAFADVERAMQQVKTVSWESNSQVYDKFGHNAGSLVDVKWLRRNPPALAETVTHVTPSRISNYLKGLSDTRGRFLITQHEFVDIQKRRMVTRDECLVVSVPNDPIRQMVENQIVSFTEFPQAAPSSTFGGQVQTTTTNFVQSSAVVNGQNQVRFDRDIKTVWIWKDHTEHQMAHVSTWADPETHRVIRNKSHISENTFWRKRFKPYEEVEDQFRYDQTPPKGTFDWSPPAGMKVVRMPAKPAKK